MFYIISIILICIGIGLYFGYRLNTKKLFQIKATQTSSSAELLQEAKDVEEGMGEKGSYNRITEVKGKVLCADPIVSELAKKKCVHYSMSIVRKWEEKYWETDSEGRRIQKTRQGSDTVACNERTVPFYVEDSTGKIKINPEGAEMLREKVFSQFKPGDITGGSISIGSFSMPLAGILSVSGRRTTGYAYEESIIPVDRVVYVLGEAADSSGELNIQKPHDNKHKFIISIKSEEELKRNIEGTMKAMLIGGIISETGGIVLLVLKTLGILS